MTDTRWPIEPIMDELYRRMGEYDQENNPYGYTHGNAAVLLASRTRPLSAEVWGRKVRRGWLKDDEADRFATQLGHNPIDFWPAFGDVALEQPDDETDECAVAVAS